MTRLSKRLSSICERHPEIASSYNNAVNASMGKGDLDKALEYFQRSLSIRLDVLDEQHPDVSASYNNIRQVYSAKDDKDKALNTTRNRCQLGLVNWEMIILMRLSHTITLVI